MLSKDTLILFLKNPDPGFVKKRLAKDIGKDNASFLYRLFVEAILKRTEPGRFKRMIFYTPSAKKKEIQNWIGRKITMYPQKGKNLGSRLSYAFRLAFQKGAKRVVAIGTDMPLIDNKIIRSAFQKLENRRCVIGPCFDGGYYLLGLSHFYRGVFQNIAWGTDRVFKQTLNILKSAKLGYCYLDKCHDIDNIEDLAAIKRRLQKMDKRKRAGLIPMVKAINKIIV